MPILTLGAEEVSLTFWQQFVLKFLDWPVLFAVILVGLILLFRRQLGALLARGGVTLTWGDKSIAIAELPEKLNEDFAPITDDIQDIKDRSDAVRDGSAPEAAAAQTPAAPAKASANDGQNPQRRKPLKPCTPTTTGCGAG